MITIHIPGSKCAPHGSSSEPKHHSRVSGQTGATPNPPDERQDKDEPPRLSWDPNAPPAPVDVHAFARRAGEIIARAARAACKGFRRD
jgi:hypothetical protein